MKKKNVKQGRYRLLALTSRQKGMKSPWLPCIHHQDMQYKKTFMNTLGEKVIVDGDFNAKYMPRESLLTTEGKELQVISETKGKCHSTGKPTYWTTDSRHITITYTKVEEGEEPSSDHSRILLTLSENVITKQQNSTVTNKGTNWKSGTR